MIYYRVLVYSLSHMILFTCCGCWLMSLLKSKIYNLLCCWLPLKNCALFPKSAAKSSHFWCQKMTLPFVMSAFPHGSQTMDTWYCDTIISWLQINFDALNQAVNSLTCAPDLMWYDIGLSINLCIGDTVMSFLIENIEKNVTTCHRCQWWK